MDKSKFEGTASLDEVLKKIKETPELSEKPVCFLLIGTQASGKSTIAKTIVETMPKFVNFDLDSVVLKRASQMGKSYRDITKDSKLLSRCESHYNQNIIATLKSRKDFIWEQLNTHKSSRLTKIFRVKDARNRLKNGKTELSPYILIGIYTDIPLEVNLERLKNRNESTKNTDWDKFIPAKVLEKIHQEYIHPTEDEPFDLLFRCDEKLQLTFKPTVTFEEVMGKLAEQRQPKHKPSAAEIERRRAEKKALMKLMGK